MTKILLADNLPPQCASLLEEAGFRVEARPGLSQEGLKDAVADAAAVIVRSGARITREVLEGADELKVICRAGVGVDNVDVEAASRRGVVVMNTPDANTISTAEHTFALILALARNIGPAYLSMREGRWEKTRFVGSQLAGSTLGIVGLGRVGQEVARRAVASGMRVQAFDPHVSRERAEQVGVALADSLTDLLSTSDYVTVHVPESEVTRGLIGAEQVAQMRDGARVVNCARGAVVDQGAVVAAVESGKLAGAAFDVYLREPPEDFAFARNDRVLATPHLGASTQEAQVAVATAAAEQVIDALLHGDVRNAVNVQLASPEEMAALQPYCALAERLGRLAGQLCEGRPESVEVACRGALAQGNIEPIVQHGAMGFLRSSFGERANIVSVPYLAQERGIRITSSRTSGPYAGFTDVVEVTVRTESGPACAAGTLLGREHPRLIRINGFDLELVPEGRMLIVFNDDMPGAVGHVGVALGRAGVNIARMAVARQEVGGRALLAFNLDTACSPETLAEIGGHELIRRVLTVDL